MFCENCGAKLNTNDKYCDHCGKDTAYKSWYAFIFIGLASIKNTFANQTTKVVTACVILVLFIGTAAFLGYRNYNQKQQELMNALQQQKQQTASLETKVDQVKQQAEDVQKQDQQSTQNLTTQLNSQKTETQNAEQQAAQAQKALALVNKQGSSITQTSNNSGFPTINTQAIVLIICFDGSGNVLQSGSGTIVTADGYVLTNKHVVTDDNGNAIDCDAVMNDGSSSPKLETNTIYQLSLNTTHAGYYSNYDAALLQIVGATNTQSNVAVALPGSFPYIRPNGGNLKEGDNIYIFGYPGASNLVFNVNKGIVSSFTTDGTYINTDALIDHGNSGGAAITSDGRFVGIPSAKYVGTDNDYLGEILKVENLNVPTN